MVRDDDIFFKLFFGQLNILELVYVQSSSIVLLAYELRTFRISFPKLCCDKASQSPQNVSLGIGYCCTAFDRGIDIESFSWFAAHFDTLRFLPSGYKTFLVAVLGYEKFIHGSSGASCVGCSGERIPVYAVNLQIFCKNLRVCRPPRAERPLPPTPQSPPSPTWNGTHSGSTSSSYLSYRQ